MFEGPLYAILGIVITLGITNLILGYWCRDLQNRIVVLENNGVVKKEPGTDIIVADNRYTGL